MIPISDDPGPRRRFPIINYTLIAINIVVFILELTAAQPDCFTVAYSTIPYGITHDVQFVGQGCPYGQPAPVYLTLLTSMFMHGGFLHIAGNMLYLWIFGDNVEDRLGHIGYLLFYLVCGFAASAAQIAVDPNSQVPNLGASGAIAGVLGAYLVFFPGARIRTIIFLGIFFTFTTLSAVIVIGFWFLLQLVSSFAQIGQVNSGGVAYMAHVGGFVTGLVIALLLRPVLRPPARYARYDKTYPSWPMHNDLRDRGYY